MLDLVNVAWAHTCLVADQAARNESQAEGNSFQRADREELRANLFVDLSQAVQRMPWGSLSAICTSSYLYSFRFDLVLTPELMARIHGFPSDLHWPSQNATRRMVGNLFSIPVVGAVELSAFLSAGAPWFESKR